METINTGDDTEQTKINIEDYKRQEIRKSLWWMGGGAALIIIHVVIAISYDWSIFQLFQRIYFLIGILLVVSCIWDILATRKLIDKDLEVDERSKKIAEAVKSTNAIYTKIILGCLIAVALFQLIISQEKSIQSAGLVKSAVREGDTWRLLTGITLHGHLAHILMNGQALYGVGRLIESLSNRAYLAIVFLVSGICGSVFSLVLIPNTTSVGASGGIMGLIGFLAVFGYKRKEDVPENFFKHILTSIAFIGVIGLVGFAIIDNAGHLGGLLAGAAIGGLFIKTSDDSESRYIKTIVPILGYLSMLAIIGISIFSIVKIVK